MPTLMSLTAPSRSRTSGGPKRYGAQGTFVTRSGGVAVRELLNMVLELVAADAEVLDCSDQVDYCRTIVSGGTSADAQLLR